MIIEGKSADFDPIGHNVLVEILEKRSKVGEDLYSSIIGNGESICTTSINLHELLYGLRKYGKSVKELLRLPIIDYTKDAAILSSQIEYEVEKSGKAVRRTEPMIAAIAVLGSFQILTLDRRHFEPIARNFPQVLPIMSHC